MTARQADRSCIIPIRCAVKCDGGCALPAAIVTVYHNPVQATTQATVVIRSQKLGCQEATTQFAESSNPASGILSDVSKPTSLSYPIARINSLGGASRAHYMSPYPLGSGYLPCGVARHHIPTHRIHASPLCLCATNRQIPLFWDISPASRYLPLVIVKSLDGMLASCKNLSIQHAKYMYEHVR
jgi:hypothetical protein